jgi:hypothetical protein
LTGKEGGGTTKKKNKVNNTMRGNAVKSNCVSSFGKGYKRRPAITVSSPVISESVSWLILTSSDHKDLC